MSEFAGSVWCLNWHAESWSWSRGFFKASSVFLLSMAYCHIPTSFHKYKKLECLLASMPFLFLISIMFKY